MEFYMLNIQYDRMILESVQNAKAIQADCNVKATNIILQGLSPEVYALVSTHKVAKELWERIQMLMQGTSLTKQDRECKLYDEFDKFAYRKGETLRDFYLRFSLLLNDMNMYNMKLEQFQVNTKFLNTLPSEWSKFVTDVKLVRDLHTTNFDQLHAYLDQHEYHANEVRLMHERTSDPLALISQHQMNWSTYQYHQQSYHQPQFQQQALTYQSSPYETSYHTPQYVSQAPSSSNLSISYLLNDIPSIVNHNAYMASSLIPQIEYAPTVHQHPELSSPKIGLVFLVFQKGDDPIDAINHMMSFLTTVVTSSSSRSYASGSAGALGKQRERVLKEQQNNAKASVSYEQSLEIKTLKHTISDHLKEKESLEQNITLLKNDFQKEESRNIDRELALEKQALGFQNPCYLKRAQQLKPKLYDGSVIEKSNAIVDHDSEETLLLAEESLVVLKELPKVSLVNSSLKELKFHLASFNMVVKERTTTTDITEGMWGFEHTKACFRDDIIPFVKVLEELFNSFDQFLIDELSELQQVFKKMEQAVEQHCVEKNKFQNKMKNVLQENDRLLTQEISVDIVNLVVYENVNSVCMNVNSCKRCVTIESELKKNFIKKDCYDTLFQKYNTLEKHCISLEVDNQLKKEISQRNTLFSPETPKLRKNRTAHTDYIRHTQEKAATLREIVESERLLNPLNTSLDYACKYTRRIQELLIILKQTCPCLTDLGTKIVAVTPKNKTKQIRFTEQIPKSGKTTITTTPLANVDSKTPMFSFTGVTLLYSASGSMSQDNTKKNKIQRTQRKAKKNKLEDYLRTVKPSLNKKSVVDTKATSSITNSMSNVNSDLKCASCNGCLFFDNHDACVVAYINSVNASIKSKSVNTPVKRKIWQPTGK
nr:hypothetical protein [Tanacetum cinerariifolium]